MPVLFNIVLEVLAREVRKEKEVKGIQIKREEIKLSLFVNDTPHIEHSKDSTRKLLELIKRIQQSHWTQNHIQKFVMFLYINNKLSEREIKKTI